MTSIFHTFSSNHPSEIAQILSFVKLDLRLPIMTFISTFSRPSLNLLSQSKAWGQTQWAERNNAVYRVLTWNTSIFSALLSSPLEILWRDEQQKFGSYLSHPPTYSSVKSTWFQCSCAQGWSVSFHKGWISFCNLLDASRKDLFLRNFKMLFVWKFLSLI